MIVLLWAGLGRSAEPPPRPDLTEELPGMPDCPRALEFTPGQKWEPPVWLVDGDGIVQCRATIEPYTSFADLLNIEAEYERLRGLYRVDTTELEARIGGWKWRAEWAEGKLQEPVPFTTRPWFNQVLGAGVVLGVGYVVIWGDRELAR